MGNTFRVINYDGDIEISIYKKANAVFKTNEYNETEDVCIHKETINIFNLLKENQELKQKLNWIAFGDDPELALRYLRKIGYVDFDEERKVYINKHNNEPFLLDDEEEKAYYIKSEELNEYTEQLEYQNNELNKQLEEWEHHLKCSKKMLYIQGQKGNYDYDEYMLGIYNGMEYIIALFETREPNYISGKDVEFTNNKNQQKEFIKYLEDGIEKATTNPYTKLSEYGMNRIHIYNEILQKYKEITGVSDEKK